MKRESTVMKFPNRKYSADITSLNLLTRKRCTMPWCMYIIRLGNPWPTTVTCLCWMITVQQVTRFPCHSQFYVNPHTFVNMDVLTSRKWSHSKLSNNVITELDRNHIVQLAAGIRNYPFYNITHKIMFPNKSFTTLCIYMRTIYKTQNIYTLQDWWVNTM